jgi:uncharacterized membrane protein YccC
LRGEIYLKNINMGSIDRIIGVVLVVVVGILYMTVQISVIADFILGLFAAIFLMTSEVGCCPLYVPLGISKIIYKNAMLSQIRGSILIIPARQ